MWIFAPCIKYTTISKELEPLKQDTLTITLIYSQTPFGITIVYSTRVLILCPVSDEYSFCRFSKYLRGLVVPNLKILMLIVLIDIVLRRQNYSTIGIMGIISLYLGLIWRISKNVKLMDGWDTMQMCGLFIIVKQTIWQILDWENETRTILTYLKYLKYFPSNLQII